MYCPRCSQERVSEETRFCSRCGFLLTAASELLLTDGVPGANLAKTEPQSALRSDSPRTRGIKRGIFLMMSAIVLAPVLGLIFRFGFNMMPWPMGVVLFLFGGGGLLRIIYALFFESKYADPLAAPEEGRHTGSLAGGHINRELPAGERTTYIPPIGVPAGNWRDTRDLQPETITDRTTQLLEKEQD